MPPSPDYQIPGVMDELDKNGYTNDTYVIYMSDNGYHMGQW